MFNRFQHALNDIRRWLKEDQSGDARFSMMVDLYSLPSDFPGYDEAMKHDDPFQQARILEEALKEEITDIRFVPYLQVHEFEALVLAEPLRFADWFDHAQGKAAALVKECEPFPSPEHIDHGQHSHPKARVRRHFPDYDENLHGPLLAADIGLHKMRAECSHFNGWLTKLESLDR